IAFAEALPLIRERTSEDLAQRGLPREKGRAAVVQQLDRTLHRVRNQEHAKENDSYGLTQLRKRHVGVEGPQVRFEFRGKSGQQHEVDIQDRRLANIVKKCLDIPGYELFKYIDEDGERQDVESSHVND